MDTIALLSPLKLHTRRSLGVTTTEFKVPRVNHGTHLHRRCQGTRSHIRRVEGVLAPTARGGHSIYRSQVEVSEERVVLQGAHERQDAGMASAPDLCRVQLRHPRNVSYVDGSILIGGLFSTFKCITFCGGWRLCTYVLRRTDIGLTMKIGVSDERGLGVR